MTAVLDRFTLETDWPVLDQRTAMDATAGTAVVWLDAWTPAQADALSAHAWETGMVLLPVRADGETALIGPLLYPGAPACLGCVETQRLATIGGRTPRAAPGLLLGGVPAPTCAPLISALADAALADPRRWAATVWVVRTGAADCSTHRARPRAGGCDLCGPLPVDAPESVRFVPSGALLTNPYRLRADNPATTLRALRGALHDWRLGPVAHVSRRTRFPLALAHAEVVGDWESRDGGYGRAATYADAERVALFEAVERMAGLSPRARSTRLRAAFNELGPENALDPARLGMLEPDALHHPGFRLAAYDPDAPTTWVYGWSLGESRALAVPEQLAYWGYPLWAGPRNGGQFLLESSNGCGLGNSPEEAVLYGLLEIAERDAFLMAWYARTPLPLVETPADDPLINHLSDHVDALGYDLLLLNASNDFGVPVVASALLCRDRESPTPQAFFAAGAHPDPREAVRSAVVEVVVNLLISIDLAVSRPGTYDRGRLRPMLERPDLVITPEDHTALYTLPESRPRFAFLLGDGAPAKPWQEHWPDLPQPHPDLAALVARLAERAAGAGMDVIVVDQTDPVVRDRLGLHAAKVIVPGAIPLVFGHSYRRTRGLPRLLDVPWRLGRLQERAEYDSLPFHPHPFP